MSFLSKAWKSIKGAVKSIGKGLRSAAKSVGKFMGKVGIVGQIAMAFILPGIGTMLGGMLGSGVTAMAGSSNMLLSGVGKVLQTAGKFASTAGNAWRTVTDGILNFTKNIGQGFVNKTASLLGKNAPVFSAGPTSVSDGFQKWMQGVAEDAGNVTSPFSKVSQEVSSEVVDSQYDKFMSNIPDMAEEAATTGFDTNYRVPSLLDKNMEFGLNTSPEYTQQIINSELRENNTFLSKINNYSKKIATGMVEQTTDTFSRSVGQGVATRLGLAPEPRTEITNISNPIPAFNSTPLSNVYESSGLNYGALPSNRLQFYASQAYGGSDFGMNSFSNFARFRVAQ